MMPLFEVNLVVTSRERIPVQVQASSPQQAKQIAERDFIDTGNFHWHKAEEFLGAEAEIGTINQVTEPPPWFPG